MKKLIVTFTLLCSLGYAYAHPGIGLVYDGNHTIYYTDLTHVWKLNTDTGETEIAIPNIHTHELFMDEQGVLYGEHYWYEEAQEKFKNYIWKWTPEVGLIKIRNDIYGENSDFGFVRNQDFESFEIHNNGSAHEIIKNDSLSQQILFTTQLNHPGWKYLDKDGTFLFADYPSIYSFQDEKLTKIAEEVSYSRLPFSIQSDDHTIYGIWTDSLKNVYVAIYGGRVVKKINPHGEITNVLKTGFFWSPVNGVFDKHQNLWLMESKLNGTIRIRKITPDKLTSKAGFTFENMILTGIVLLFGGLFYRLMARRKISIV